MTPDTVSILEGHVDVRDVRLAIVVSRFNEFVTSRLLTGALEVLSTAGLPSQRLLITRVPGAFEIPLVVRRLAASGSFDAIVCLGAIVRGETPHFEYISAETSRGIREAARDFNLPVIFGVLTTDTVEQALARAGPPERNRGADAARTALEMVSLLRQLPTGSGRRAAQASPARRRRSGTRQDGRGRR